MEVTDHFMSQITQLRDDENLGFEEALLKTKILWQDELKMVKGAFLSFKRITSLEKKLLKNRFNKIIARSLSYTILFFILNLFNAEVSIYILIFMLFTAFLILLYNLIFKKLTFFEYISFSLHPIILKSQLIAILLFYVLLPLILKIYTPVYDIRNSFFILILVFQVCTQIQLFIFYEKKINVLIS
ncbi:hypothetical protein [Halpernia sp. GG3]